MGIFDEHIGLVDGYLERLRGEGRQAREFPPEAGQADPSAPSPFRVGPGAGTGLVLKSDTFVELGSPTAGSCAFALYTGDSSLVRDGRIRLVGPDIQESASGTLSFGQVILAAGRELDERDYRPLAESQYVGDRIEGFMVKSTPGRIWCRVSNDIARRGFDFGVLGKALIGIVKDQVPGAEAVDVLFVTSGREDVLRLGEIEARVGEVAREIKRRVWKEKGIDIDDCPLGGHCGSCKDKEVCDEVRKMTQGRKRAS
jgi:CO dehydrogenase/acetyl-CoA synthase beta subunit